MSSTHLSRPHLRRREREAYERSGEGGGREVPGEGRGRLGLEALEREGEAWREGGGPKEEQKKPRGGRGGLRRGARGL